MAPSPQPDAAGARRPLPSQLGRFTLLRELGAGGMATVYLGKMRLAEGLERLVAVKTIHDELADQSAFVDMFLDEAKIATLINHPNVCSVHDFGQSEGTYFMAMEYLVGEPLSEVIRQVWEHRRDEAVLNALPFFAARIVADACEGLHAAHETVGAGGQKLEVVHRDVSPQNLFVTYEGAVKVVDFGCAKALQRITETNAGIFKGKLAYAAPEQLKIQKLDARTDVWALGAVLWEALTLERVFKRESPMQTARAILEERIPRVDELEPYIHRELADIVARALTRAPDGRYQSARDMGRALRRFIAGAGATFESAETADWMRYLFRKQRRERMRVAAEAEATLASHVAPAAALLSDSRTLPEEQPPTLEASLDELSEPMAPVPLSRPRLDAAARPEPEPADDAERSRDSGRPPSLKLRLNEEDRVAGPPREAATGSWFLSVVALLLVAAAAGAWGFIASGGEPPAASQPAGVGTVIVEAASGEADVYRGEERLGRTPLTVELPAGDQRLTLQGFGRDLTEEVTVPVVAGETARITVRPR